MMTKAQFVFTILYVCINQAHEAYAQLTISPHKLQAEKYKNISVKKESDWNTITRFVSTGEKNFQSTEACKLNKTVFGWHPYWMGTTYEQYDYRLLSDIAYFSYEVDPTTGRYKDIHFWKTTNLVDMAQEAGTRVSLSVTLFGQHATFLTNLDARNVLIDSLISLLQYRNAKGINIDFEGIPFSQRDNFTDFIFQLSGKFHQKIPDAFLSMALPAVDWQEVIDVEAMKEVVDLFIVMGYNYYWSSSPVAGPVSPKNSGQLWSPYNVTTSILDYLQRGIPKEKLCLGVPYYGYDWEVEHSGVGVQTASRGDAVIYTTAKKNAQVYRSNWENHASVPYFEYELDGKKRQTWYDNEISLGFKYDLVKMLNIAGIGIWALGYDRNTTALWKVLQEKFTSCGYLPTDGNFSDLGGPEGNYYPGVSLKYSISANDTSNVQLLFRNIAIKSGDTLKLYHGNDSLIRIFTHRSHSTAVIQARTPLEFEFIASGDESGSGWDMNWFTFTNDIPAYALSATTIDENKPQNSQIATVLITDSALLGSKFNLSSGMGIYDNDLFYDAQNKLYASTSFNYEKQSAYFIRSKLSCLNDSSMYRNFLITVADKNDPPTISGSAPMTIYLDDGEPFDFCLARFFYDEDERDTLEFNASLENGQNIPGWMNYDTITLCFSGNAPDTTNLTMLVEAWDTAGDSIGTTLILQSDTYANVDHIQESEINVYPNPFVDFLTIDPGNSFLQMPMLLQVVDLTGKVVSSYHFKNTNDVIKINTSAYGAGYYTVILTSLSNNKSFYYKLMHK